MRVATGTRAEQYNAFEPVAVERAKFATKAGEYRVRNVCLRHNYTYHSGSSTRQRAGLRKALHASVNRRRRRLQRPQPTIGVADGDERAAEAEEGERAQDAAEFGHVGQ